MIFYFSGIGNKSTFKLLEGLVTDFLVDEVDIKNLPQNQRIGILDSGAYRLFKKGLEINLFNYLERTIELAHRCDRIVAPDVIGNPELTFENFGIVKNFSHLQNKIIPVWQWSASRNHLEYYLKMSPLVGIGGLAKTFHLGKTPEEKKYRDKVLAEIKELSQSYPNRFHIFGLNYLKAIEELSPIVYSADSSVWLRGAKYGFVIFKHEKNQHLTQAPAKAIPQFAQLGRDERCSLSAKNIDNFVKGLI